MNLPAIGRLRQHEAFILALASGAPHRVPLIALDTTIVNVAPPSIGRDLNPS